jgi:hypothetical protein
MVTKGYRKGVYDRVTEGTCETEPLWEKQVPTAGGMGAVCAAQKKDDPRNQRLGACQCCKSEYQNSKQGGPGQAANDMPNHKAHRVDPPRGGNRE